MKFHDLSQPIFNDVPQWPDYRPTSVTRTFSVGAHGFNAERVELTTHTGTHVDVPFHFVEEGVTIDQLPLDHFAGLAIAFDLRAKGAESVITRDDLATCDIRPDDIVLLKTGWGEKRAMTREFLRCWPYLDAGAAEYLVDRNVKGVGLDALSIGGIGESEVSRAPHLPLLRANKFIVEDMRIPDALLDGKRRFFAAFPILIKGAGAAWVRAVAWDA